VIKKVPDCRAQRQIGGFDSWDGRCGHDIHRRRGGIRNNYARPIGSLTQMGTIRLGKRTERRTPLIKDFVPLSSLNDLVFGGWDINNETCYETAVRSGVLEPQLLNLVRPSLRKSAPGKPFSARNMSSGLRGPT